MRTPSLLAVLSLGLLGLTACVGKAHPPGACGQVLQADAGATFFDTRNTLLLPGARSVFSGRAVFGVCPPGYDYPTVTGVEVTAPSGAALPASWHRDRSGAVAADFTTAEAGPHLVSVQYAPDPATLQPPASTLQVANVARDRSATPRATLPGLCLRLDRTEGGAWICDAQVFRGGVLVQTLDPAWVYAVEGTSVWGAGNGGEVARWVDPGTGPLQPVNALPAFGQELGVTNVLPAGDEVLVRRADWLDRYVMPADGGTARAAGSLVVQGSGPVARSGADLLVAGTDLAGTTRTCAYHLEGDQLSGGASCLDREVVGATAGGLWISRWPTADLYRAENGSVVLAALVDGPGLVAYSVGGRDELAFNFVPVRGPHEILFPVLQPGAPTTFDAYPIDGDYRGARRDFFWRDVVALDGGTNSTEVIFR